MLAEYDLKPAETGGEKKERDFFTVGRADGDLTFERGDHVKAWISKNNFIEGEIVGISRARNEFKVGKGWYKNERAYKAEQPAPKEPKVKPVPLSKVVESVNKEGVPEGGFTEADKPTPPGTTPEKGKEPWEMGKEEWMKQRPAGTSPGMHSWEVKKAIKEGKIDSHPEYPELSKPAEYNENAEVTVKVINEQTGRILKVKQKAKEALAEIDEQIATYKALLECI